MLHGRKKHANLRPDQIFPHPDPDPTGAHTRNKWYRKQIVECECGRRLERASMKVHLRSKHHAFSVLNKKIDDSINEQSEGTDQKNHERCERDVHNRPP